MYGERKFPNRGSSLTPLYVVWTSVRNMYVWLHFGANRSMSHWLGRTWFWLCVGTISDFDLKKVQCGQIDKILVVKGVCDLSKHSFSSFSRHWNILDKWLLCYVTLGKQRRHMKLVDRLKQMTVTVWVLFISLFLITWSCVCCTGTTKQLLHFLRRSEAELVPHVWIRQSFIRLLQRGERHCPNCQDQSLKTSCVSMAYVKYGDLYHSLDGDLFSVRCVWRKRTAQPHWTPWWFRIWVLGRARRWRMETLWKWSIQAGSCRTKSLDRSHTFTIISSRFVV